MSEISSTLKARGGEKKKIHRLLLDLIRLGEATKTRNHRYAPAVVPERLSGRLQYNRRGFGFVIPDDGSEDLFVPGGSLGGAIHGDRVSVEIAGSGRGRPEGRVREVLARGIRTLVGKIRFRNDRSAFLAPFGPEIPYPVSVTTPLPNDFDPETDPVVAVCIDWKQSEPELLRGSVVKVLGPIDDPAIDSWMVIYRNDLPRAFPEDVEIELRRIPGSVTTADLEGRKDLRALPFVTIDGADARDHDDAVALDESGELWVAIADVGHYVHPDRPLDREAAGRGNSFYFPDRVLPMLPERLSNDLCSLRPGLDRLCLAARLTIRPDGAPAVTELFEAVIHSRARLTYEEVDAALAGEDVSGRPIADRMPMLRRMLEVAESLFRTRVKEGGIDFDLSETKIVLDTEGVVTAMARRERTPAQRIVEEFMLAANRGVARTLHSALLPSIYRVHEKPDARKLSDYLRLLRAYGYTVNLDPEKADPTELGKLVRRFENDPRGKVFSYLALRSMKQARYSQENVGHYGLGFGDYLHFTSPIRRYADLVVHRSVRAFLRRRRGDEPLFPASYGTLENLASYISAQERLAQTSEREIRTLKGIRFLRERRGESFAGRVTGMVSQGFFVELEDHAVEGFVQIGDLTNDRFDFFEREMIFRGRRHGKTIRLGDRFPVRVENASIEEFRLQFRPS